MITHNFTGILKLKDNDLNLNYGLYTGSEYIELSNIFNELIDRRISVNIIKIKKNRNLTYYIRGTVHREKVGKYYILKISDKNIDDIFFDLVETKLNIRIKTIDNIEDNEREDIIK